MKKKQPKYLVIYEDGEKFCLVYPINSKLQMAILWVQEYDASLMTVKRHWIFWYQRF